MHGNLIGASTVRFLLHPELPLISNSSNYASGEVAQAISSTIRTLLDLPQDPSARRASWADFDAVGSKVQLKGS